MHGPLVILRALARPLAALGIVLMLMATVVPVATAAGACIANDVLGTGTPAAPFCDACLPVALPTAPPAVPGERAVTRADVAPVAAEMRAAVGPEAERIRDPPAA